MTVSELIEWLKAFEDQDAVVEVLHCQEGYGYYAQGGITGTVEFNPERHTEYTDFRGNQFAKNELWAQKRTLLLGLDES